MEKRMCVGCSNEIESDIKVDSVKEGDSVVYIEYFICPKCNLKNIIEIYRVNEQCY